MLLSILGSHFTFKCPKITFSELRAGQMATAYHDLFVTSMAIRATWNVMAQQTSKCALLHERKKGKRYNEQTISTTIKYYRVHFTMFHNVLGNYGANAGHHCLHPKLLLKYNERIINGNPCGNESLNVLDDPSSEYRRFLPMQPVSSTLTDSFTRVST